MLRAEPDLEGLPILAMTANAFNEDRQACLAAGMTDHLVKPVNPQLLYETLLRWLPIRACDVPLAPPETPALVTPPSPRSAAQRLEGIAALDLAATYEQCAGKPEIAVRVLRQFMTHYRSVGAALMDHLQEGQLEEPRRKLHSLRGASAAVGALQIEAVVKQLEAALKADAPSGQLLALGEDLRQQLDALTAELAVRLAE